MYEHMLVKKFLTISGARRKNFRVHSNQPVKNIIIQISGEPPSGYETKIKRNIFFCEPHCK